MGAPPFLFVGKSTSMTSRSLFARDTQIIILRLSSFSRGFSTVSRWSGMPESTLTSHAPHTPSVHEPAV